MQHLKTFLRSARPNNLGECILYFRVGAEWISTDIKVHPDYWDPIAEAIKKNHPKYFQLNPVYQQIKLRAEQCFAANFLDGSVFNRKLFTDFVFTSHESYGNPCFLKLIDEYCNLRALSWARIKHYQELKKDLQAVHQRPKLLQIDFYFLTQLKSYLKNKATPNNENTIIRKIKQIKAVVHYCQNVGYIKNDPLINFKLKQIKGDKKYLTAAELETLENLYQQGFYKESNLQVLRYFLFSCYTGLRYGDIQKLQFKDIANEVVCTTQEKTNKPVYVPLIPKAMDLLFKSESEKCFDVQTNQATNRILKKIMAAAGINKKITYHCSRHTFGTLSIYWGIPREVVAELMGVDEATVKIYAQIVSEVKNIEMLKWTARAV